MPVVEVVGGRDILPEVKEHTCYILKSVGKHPIMVEKGAPFLIGKRLQNALRREALLINKQGIADPTTVNVGIKKALSIHLSVEGTLGNANHER